MAEFKVLFQHLPGGTEVNHKNLNQGSWFPGEIWHADLQYKGMNGNYSGMVFDHYSSLKIFLSIEAV
jgi:hypothetical protein